MTQIRMTYLEIPVVHELKNACICGAFLFMLTAPASISVNVAQKIHTQTHTLIHAQTQTYTHRDKLSL